MKRTKNDYAIESDHIALPHNIPSNRTCASDANSSLPLLKMYANSYSVAVFPRPDADRAGPLHCNRSREKVFLVDAGSESLAPVRQIWRHKAHKNIRAVFYLHLAFHHIESCPTFSTQLGNSPRATPFERHGPPALRIWRSTSS